MVCGHRFLQAHVQTESSKVNKMLTSDITDIANFLPSRSGTFHIYKVSATFLSKSVALWVN